MPKVVSVRFHDAGKIYHFAPADFHLHLGDAVIVETSQGIDLGHIAEEAVELPMEQIIEPLLPIIRFANEEDNKRYEDKKKREKEAFAICNEKVHARGLKMNLVEAEYSFDGKKLVFFFTADGRVDFRELVKDLAAVFRTRIELRQIGVRDQARMVGGLGLCGRELCCCSFLNDFVPVSIKMAKEQGLSMNPTKISGACGRLMCCLKYEQEAYEDAHARLPKQGDIVMTAQGRGTVVSVDLLREKITVRLELDDEADLITVLASESEVLLHKNKKPTQGCASCDKHKGVECPSDMDGDDSDPIEDDMEEDGMRAATDEHSDEDAENIVDYSIADDGHVLDDEIIDFKE
jgi:cell fate regulator YaaT (PSP1 superfamily)